MSSSPDAVLASIDSALEDYAVSGDAMRWNPDAGRVICDRGGTLSLAPSAGTDPFGNLARCGAAAAPLIILGWPKLSPDLVHWFEVPDGMTIAAFTASLIPGVTVTCWGCGGNWRRARCTTCHPLAFPGPILGRKPSVRSQGSPRRKRRG